MTDWVIHLFRGPGVWCEFTDRAVASTSILGHATCLDCLRAKIQHLQGFKSP